MEKWSGALEGMVIDKQFWKNKRVFLTGHTGFKGSWLSLWLQHLGVNLTGYALQPPTNPAIFEIAGVADNMDSQLGDIRDLKQLTRTMQQAKPEIVIHMAAQSLVRDSYDDPVGTYSTNIMGTVNLFDAARRVSSVKAVLNVTSDKCYENREWSRGYIETDTMGGFDPYSSSKGCAELVTSAYRQSFFNASGIGLASARAGNVIGGGDWASNRLVPDAIRAFMRDEPLMIRNPMAVRPWQHVIEPLSGYLMLCQKLYQQPENFSEGWNFGPLNNEARPVSYIADQIVKNWEGNARWGLDKNSHPHEAGHLTLDCSKAGESLEWEPVWELDRALKETVFWYKAWQQKENMHNFTIRQIDAYS